MTWVFLGSLDSTEVTYSTKAQADRPSLQDTPISSSKKLPGKIVPAFHSHSLW